MMVGMNWRMREVGLSGGYDRVALDGQGQSRWRQATRVGGHARRAAVVVIVPAFGPSTSDKQRAMGLWSDTLVKVGLAQPGPKITPHDRAVLE